MIGGNISIAWLVLLRDCLVARHLIHACTDQSSATGKNISVKSNEIVTDSAVKNVQKKLSSAQQGKGINGQRRKRMSKRLGRNA